MTGHRTLERKASAYTRPDKQLEVKTGETSPLLRWLVRSAVILLVVIGASAGIARTVFVADLATRAEPVRQQALAATGREDPFASQRPALLEQVDGRYARNQLVTVVHTSLGALFLVLATFQFSSRIRRRYVAFHRWSGRLLVVTGLVMAIAGLYFGVLMPFAGIGEVVVVVLFGGLFIVAIAKAFVAIRRRQVARHREWMIRAFAVGLGISTVRIFALVLDVTLTPWSFTPQTIFVMSLWLGFASTLGAAELWLAHTRALALPVPRPDREQQPFE